MNAIAKFLTLFMAAAVSAPLARGVPAWPGLIPVTQPDGSVVNLRLTGDEHGAFMTDASATEIMRRDSDGFWRAVGKVESQPVAPQRMAALDPQGRTTYPTTAENVHSLIVLLEFSDESFALDNIVDEISRKCNEEGYNGYDARGSLRDYWRDVSGGKFAPAFDIAGPVKLPESSEWYALYDRAGDRRWSGALRFALEKLHEEGLDSSKYDYDGDGIIDTVYFIYCGHGSHDTGDMTRIWPHQGNYQNEIFGDLVLDGKTFEGYACSNELIADHRIPQGASAPYLDGIGTIAHEYAHVLGLPDFYDISPLGNAVTPGQWSLMCQGCYNANSTCPVGLSAFEKWCLNWLETTEAHEGTSYTLGAGAKGGGALRISTSDPQEYFILESRDHTGWDAENPGEGLLIWHIDYDAEAWATSQVNYGPLSRVLIHYPSGVNGPGATWPSDDGRFFIYPAGLYPLEPRNRNAAHDAFVTSIAYDPETGTTSFDYRTVTTPPAETVGMLPPVNGGADSRKVTLSWEESPGAEGYALTVYRESAKGRVIVGGCDDRIVRGCSYELSNLSSTAWNGELHASVKVIRGIPAEVSGEEIVFVPSQAESSLISTSENYADAAEYYTLQGVRVASPVAGHLYIVRRGTRVSKAVCM